MSDIPSHSGKTGQTIQEAAWDKQLNIIVWQPELCGISCEEVTEFNTPELNSVVEKLISAMYRFDGIGLAAAQCGIFKRLAVIGLPHEKPFALINPRLTETANRVRVTEGCLSLPGFKDRILRWGAVTCEYQDVLGEWHGVAATGLLAQAIQHEKDHMNGTFYVDHMSRLKRSLILEKHRKKVKMELRRRASVETDNRRSTARG